MRKSITVVIAIIGTILMISCGSNGSSVNGTSISKPKGVVEIESNGEIYNVLSTKDLDKMMSLERPMWHGDLMYPVDEKPVETIEAYKYAINYCLSKNYDWSKMTWYWCWTKEEQLEYIDLLLKSKDVVISWDGTDTKNSSRVAAVTEAGMKVKNLEKRTNKKHSECRREKRNKIK